MATQIKKEKKQTWDANAEMKRRREEAQAKKKQQGQFSSAAQRTQKSLGGSLQQIGSTSKGKGSSSNSGTLYGNSSKISNASLKGTTADERNRKKISNQNKLKQLTDGAYEDAFGRKNKRLDRVR
jgi:hypothetical protein